MVVKKDALANLVNGKGFVENDAVLQSSTPATDDTLLPIETAVCRQLLALDEAS